MVDYIYFTYYQKEIDKLKRKEEKWQETKAKEVMAIFSNVSKSQIVEMFKLYNMIVDAKHMVVRKLDKAKSIGPFYVLKMDSR